MSVVDSIIEEKWSVELNGCRMNCFSLVNNVGWSGFLEKLLFTALFGVENTSFQYRKIF